MKAAFCSLAVMVGISTRLLGGVVINEIMYHPPEDADELQFVEIHNTGDQAVQIGQWKFTRGIDFVFPAGFTIPAGGFGVVCKDANAFAGHYGRQVPIAGTFKGRLSHNGEILELADEKGTVVDAVKFADESPWPTGADGISGSLERICPTAASQDPSNWSSSRLPDYVRAVGTPGARNDSFSALPLPVISLVKPQNPVAGRPVEVLADVRHAAGVSAVTLSWWSNAIRGSNSWNQVIMQKVSGGETEARFKGVIPAQEPGRVVRYLVRADGADKTFRFSPSQSETRPAYSYAISPGPNQARVSMVHVYTLGTRERQGPSLYNHSGASAAQKQLTRGTTAVVVVRPGQAECELFDYVRSRPRPNGLKLNFLNDQSWDGLDSVNVIYETGRSALSEPLSFELFKLAGVPAPESRHARVWVDGRALGYQLVVEQPNKSFLRKNDLSPAGNLYKLLWYENGPIRQHEKKTNLRTGHADLQQALQGLQLRSQPAQWEFIRNHFDVECFSSYYAVNMCIQNWDGFFNNYFVHHDLSKGGKWSIIPWDEDKTWGSFDGGSGNYDWYNMPLTMGMNGDQPPKRGFSFGGDGGGPFGGGPWWRPPGWFSGPLLANPEFRKLFLARLRTITETVFIPEKMNPLIDDLEKKLEPEIVFRAQLNKEKPEEALRRFRSNIQSFRNQVVHRRRFILQELIQNQR